MPQLTEQQLQAVNILVNLYEKYLELAFAVLSKKIVSTHASIFFLRNGFKESLLEAYESAFAEIDPPNIRGFTVTADHLFPVHVLSHFNAESYKLAEDIYGDFKTYSDGVGAHGKEMPAKVSLMIQNAEAVIAGKRPEQKILLSECTIATYDRERSMLLINDIPINFAMMNQVDYFNRVMFSYPISTPTTWENVNSEISENWGRGECFSSWHSMSQAMYRANEHIKDVIGTADNFYTQKKRMITRHYGPNTN